MPNNRRANELVSLDCQLPFCWARVTTSDYGIVSLELSRVRTSLSVTNQIQGLGSLACLKGCARDLAQMVRRRLLTDLNLVDLPVHPTGTPFQLLVWRHLREIPFGTTVSYGEVARAIRHPNAIRAVANACARNTIALAIPCHRVVRQDGDPGGFRWGTELKREILRLERSGRVANERMMGGWSERLS